MYATKCDLCGRSIPPHAHYLVKVEVYADPATPPLETEDVGEQDVNQTLRELLSELEQYSAEELQDQVHRRFEFRLCPDCQLQFLANPLGKPRGVQQGRN